MTSKKLAVLGVILLTINVLLGQAEGSFWRELEETQISTRSGRLIHPETYRTLSLNIAGISEYLQDAPEEVLGQGELGVGVLLSLPSPEGGELRFKVYETQVLAPELAARYPEIRTWLGQGIDDARASVRLDITPAGFHALMFLPEGSAYIDPFVPGNRVAYQCYWKKDFQNTEAFSDEVLDPGLEPSDDPLPPVQARLANGRQLRTYRIAIGATGEYSQFHGGTVATALAAITTTLNRVLGVYERDVAVRLILVPNNDQVIFLDGSTDPYSNTDPSAMLSQNQATLNSVIGQGNYDIGHVFSTGGGGLAGLGVVCSNNSFNHKAYGVTGIGNPIGDPYDIDYVAHEIGHQFDAEHTFNSNLGSCSGNRSASSAYEPGSGSTIMAYAGLCASHNIQNNSHDYFHTRSYEQIVNFISIGGGSLCASVTNTNNNPPLVGSGLGGFTIPVSTPFELKGLAVDPDRDSLTYTWEEYDLGPAGSPSSPVGDAPIFRSFPPIPSPERTFPKVSDIVNNTTTFGELLPAYSRNLKFRLTARDNRIGGGGVEFANLSISVSDSAGPFSLAYPNGGEVLDANSLVRVFWMKAGTDLSPVNCQKVDIYLSLDGGYTWPILLIGDVPNSGNALIQIPDTTSTTARIKVKAGDNVFFDISNSNFTIDELNTGADPLAGAVSLSLYPNPARHFCNLEVFLQEPNSLWVEVYNVAGQRLYAEQRFVRPGSGQKFNFEVASWPKGVYVYTVRGEGWLKSGKFVKGE